MTGLPRAADRPVMAPAVATGVASMGLFARDGRPALVPLKWPPRDALAWDAGLSLLFFAEHSGMVRRPFCASRRGEAPRAAPFSIDGTFRQVRLADDFVID